MGLKVKTIDDVTIVVPSGKLMGGKDTDELRDMIKSLISDNSLKVVIDLSKVKWMNSIGLGTLMACFTSVAVAGGDLKLAGVADKVQSLLMVTQVITLFEHYDTAKRAAAAFKE
ncbi:STAS domain-containing protein [candidate division KSB1 bacterium]